MGSSKLTFIFTLRASSTMLETRTTCELKETKGVSSCSLPQNEPTRSLETTHILFPR